MTTNAWYFDDRDAVIATIDEIRDTFPCFVFVETLELNWILVTITARVEDMGAIENRLARFA